MTEIIERLRLDHARFKALLRQLTETTQNALAGDATAEDRLFCMIEYLKDYPHQIHHPTEDLVFARVLEKPLTAEQREVISKNAAEHRALEHETERLLDNIDSLSSVTTTDIGEYVQHQTHHMEREEREVFPLADAVLTENDLHILATQYEKLHDPLFDAAESRFNALFDCLDAKGLNLGARAVASFLSAT